ncbi:MAG: SpoIVB peptidase [Clostridia bacterium]|nr:SpoIVB peptidase [Clostridia bacterium]
MNLTKKKIVYLITLCLLAVIMVMALGVVGETDEVFLLNFTGVTKTDTSSNRQVYLGGQPIGVEIKPNGLMIESILPVVTKDGVVTPLSDCDIKKGDLLKKINGQNVLSSEDISSSIENANKDNIELSLTRNGNDFTIIAKAVLDSISGEYKLGLSVSDATDGIGTLTFVDIKDGRYGALGHPISEIYGKDGSNSVNGFICNANVFSVYKGEKNRAGELVGNLVKDVKLGNIDTNETQGIFGEYTGDTSGLKKISVASHKNVKPGKAQIVSSAFTGKPTYYDIEIIKACKQEKDKPKGILYRVTDERLIKLCGGIVQGMSGSPIVQKGKLVGAVTHVFLSDSTKGYGTYIDWMIDK